MNEFNPVLLGGGAAALIAGLIVVGGSFFTVDAGERGVMLRNGAIVGVEEPGLGFKVPFIDSVVKVPIRTFTQVYEQLPAYSFDQQSASLRVSVTFSVKEAAVAEAYSQYGGVQGVVDRLIDRQVNEQVRIVFGRFTAVRAVQERGRLSDEIRQAVIESIDGPVNILDVQLENIDFSDVYEQSIEQRMQAEVEVQRVRQNAERERVSAEIVVISAEAQAKAKLASAEADAQAVRLRGEAEAAAIKARSAALADNPGIIALTTAESWNGQLPTTMVPGQSVPFIDMSGLAAASAHAPGMPASPATAPKPEQMKALPAPAPAPAQKSLPTPVDGASRTDEQNERAVQEAIRESRAARGLPAIN